MLPLTVTLTVPPLKKPWTSLLMPLPPWPELVMVSVPPPIVKLPSALMPAEPDRSLLSELSTPPDTVMVVAPPSKMTSPSDEMPFLPAALTVMPSVPSEMTTASLPRTPCPAVLLTLKRPPWKRT